MHNQRKPTLPAAPWDKPAPPRVEPKQPATTITPPADPPTAAEIEQMAAVIDNISSVHPLNFTKIMRALGKGALNFRWYFEPTAGRVTPESVEKLLALFGCRTKEEFFSLDPKSDRTLKQRIETHDIEQHRWGKPRI